MISHSKARWAAILIGNALLALPILFFLWANEGVTSLMKAAHSGDAERLSKLIENGAELDRQSRYGWTALMFASWKGHEDCVQLLLDAGADPHIRSDSVPSRFETVGPHPPTTALQEAVRNEHSDIVKLLVQADAKIDSLSVAMAAHNGDLDLLVLFEESGAEVVGSTGSAFYPSPLITAAAQGKLETVEWLVGKGAKLNRIVHGELALGEAVEKDQLEVVEFLLKAGADPNLESGLTDGTQDGPLYIAVTKVQFFGGYSRNMSIIKLLLKYGANPNQTGFSGSYTTLESAKARLAYAKKDLVEAETREHKQGYRDEIERLNTIIELLKEKGATESNAEAR